MRRRSADGSGDFIGDYQGLTSAGALFLPLFTRTNGGTTNRTDIYIAPAVSATGNASTRRVSAAAAHAPVETFAPAEELLRRVPANLARELEEIRNGPGRAD